MKVLYRIPAIENTHIDATVRQTAIVHVLYGLQNLVDVVRNLELRNVLVKIKNLLKIKQLTNKS